MTLSSVGASSLNLLSPRSKRWSLGRTAKSVAERKLGASFDLMDGAVCSEKSYPQRQARIAAPLGTLLIARSQAIPAYSVGKAWHERVGEACALVESGVVARATADSSLLDHHRSQTGWPGRQDEAPYRKLLANSG